MSEYGATDEIKRSVMEFVLFVRRLDLRRAGLRLDAKRGEESVLCTGRRAG